MRAPLQPLVFPTSGKKKTRKRRAKRGWNISQLPSGKWLARVTDPHTGKRDAEAFESQTAAESWAQDRRAKFQLAIATAARSPFAAIADDYLLDLDRRCRSVEHKDEVERVIDVFKKGGLTDLNAPNAVSIATRIIAGLKNKNGKKSSPKTQNNFLVKLNAVANWAVTRDLLIKNRFAQIEFAKTVVRDKPVFSLSEVGKLVDLRHRDHPFYLPFACMIYTGFRGSEMRNMDWSWFLWEERRIALTMGDKATLGAEEDEEEQDDYVTKTGRERLTCLPDELYELMHKEDRPTQGLVFPDLVDMDRKTFCVRFYAYLKHCGVPIVKYRTAHSCRHTWTCVRLAAGENELLVQQQAGHSRKDMTGHYARQQDRFRDQIERAGWKRNELRFRDFSPK